MPTLQPLRNLVHILAALHLKRLLQNRPLQSHWGVSAVLQPPSDLAIIALHQTCRTLPRLCQIMPHLREDLRPA